MTPQLSRSLQQAVDAHDGGPVELPGDAHSYVVMSIDVYHEFLRVLSEDEHSGARAAIDRGLADVHSGRVRPLDDVLSDLSQSA